MSTLSSSLFSSPRYADETQIGKHPFIASLAKDGTSLVCRLCALAGKQGSTDSLTLYGLLPKA
jgi:hypothetical protein